MSDHSFNPFIAEKYGDREAIFINNMIFWTRTNAGNNKNFHDDRYWSYGTPEFFSKYFPYWSERRLKTIIDNCVQKGALIKGNFNIKGYDRTNWYSLSDEVLLDLNLDKTCLKPLSSLIRQKSSMDYTKIVNALDENRRPIPDTKPDTKPYVCDTTNTIDFSDYKKAELNGLESASRESQRQNIETESITDPKNIALFNQKFGDRELTIEELFLGCKEYYAEKGGWIGSQRFRKWIQNENPENYPKKGSHAAISSIKKQKLLSDEDESLLADYKHWMKTSKDFTPLEQWIPNPDKRSRAIDLFNQEQAMLQQKVN